MRKKKWCINNLPSIHLPTMSVKFSVNSLLKSSLNACYEHWLRDKAQLTAPTWCVFSIRLQNSRSGPNETKPQTDILKPCGGSRPTQRQLHVFITAQWLVPDIDVSQSLTCKSCGFKWAPPCWLWRFFPFGCCCSFMFTKDRSWENTGTPLHRKLYEVGIVLSVGRQRKRQRDRGEWNQEGGKKKKTQHKNKTQITFTLQSRNAFLLQLPRPIIHPTPLSSQTAKSQHLLPTKTWAPAPEPHTRKHPDRDSGGSYFSGWGCISTVELKYLWLQQKQGQWCFEAFYFAWRARYLTWLRPGP